MVLALNCGKRSTGSDGQRCAGRIGWRAAGSLAVILAWSWWWCSAAAPATEASAGRSQHPQLALPGDHHRLGPEQLAVSARAPGAPVRTIVAVNAGPGPVRMEWQRGEVITAIRLAAGDQQAVRAAGVTLALEDTRATALVRVHVMQERPGMRGPVR